MVLPKISVILGTFNRLNFLKLAIATIREEIKELNHEIIVIDGGSEDRTLRWLTSQKDIITIVQHNRGKWKDKKIKKRSWGYFMNLGFKCAQGKYICMLSDDCLVIPSSIINGYRYFENQLKKDKKIAALAFYWRNWPEQNKYWVGLTFSKKMFVNHGMYLRKALKDVGYIDEETYSFYHADGDLCLKLWQKGFKCIDSPNSYIEHYNYANKKLRKENLLTQKTDWKNYQKKWSKIFSIKDDGWIEKNYFDKARTAEKYWGLKYKIYAHPKRWVKSLFVR